MKLVDLETKNIALKASWPVRWGNQDESELQWFYSQLPVKDTCIWECNLSVKDVENLGHDNTLCVSISILKAWTKFNYKGEIKEYHDILMSNLWGNSHILKSGKPRYDKVLLSSNVEKVLDVFCPTRRASLPFKEICEKYGVDFDLLYYNGLIDSIPVAWKNIIKKQELTEILDCCSQQLVKKCKQLKTNISNSWEFL